MDFALHSAGHAMMDFTLSNKLVEWCEFLCTENRRPFVAMCSGNMKLTVMKGIYCILVSHPEKSMQHHGEYWKLILGNTFSSRVIKNDFYYIFFQRLATHRCKMRFVEYFMNLCLDSLQDKLIKMLSSLKASNAFLQKKSIQFSETCSSQWIIRE